MESKELSFRIVLRPEPEGGYTVIVPSLPGCITFGETVEEAKNGKGCYRGISEKCGKTGRGGSR